VKVAEDPVGQTANFYEEIAESYAIEWLDSEVMRESCDYFIRNLLGGAPRILDVGCGPGRDAKFFSDRGFEVVGIDLAEKFLRIARQIAPSATFVKMDMRSLGFSDASFAGLWACASLLHLPRSQAGPALREFHRVLELGGLLYVSVTEGEGEGWRKHAEGRDFCAYYCKEAFKQVVSEAGFEIIQLKRSGGPAVSLRLFARPIN